MDSGTILIFSITGAVVVGLVTLAASMVHSENALHAEYEQRCNAQGMSYSRQSHMRGKVSVSWDYCVTADGTIKEIP